MPPRFFVLVVRFQWGKAMESSMWCSRWRRSSILRCLLSPPGKKAAVGRLVQGFRDVNEGLPGKKPGVQSFNLVGWYLNIKLFGILKSTLASKTSTQLWLKPTSRFPAAVGPPRKPAAPTTKGSVQAKTMEVVDWSATCTSPENFRWTRSHKTRKNIDKLNLEGNTWCWETWRGSNFFQSIITVDKMLGSLFRMKEKKFLLRWWDAQIVGSSPTSWDSSPVVEIFFPSLCVYPTLSSSESTWTKTNKQILVNSPRMLEVTPILYFPNQLKCSSRCFSGRLNWQIVCKPPAFKWGLDRSATCCFTRRLFFFRESPGRYRCWGGPRNW